MAVRSARSRASVSGVPPASGGAGDGDDLPRGVLGRTADLERAVGAAGGAGRACEAVVSVAVRSASLVSVRGQTGWFGRVGGFLWGWGRIRGRSRVLEVLVCLTGFDVDAVGFLARVSGV